LEKIRELGELVTGACLGRTSDDEVTYHKNNNGLGSADLAIAMCAYERAKNHGLGTIIDLPAPGTQCEECPGEHCLASGHNFLFEGYAWSPLPVPLPLS